MNKTVLLALGCLSLAFLKLIFAILFVLSFKTDQLVAYWMGKREARSVAGMICEVRMVPASGSLSVAGDDAFVTSGNVVLAGETIKTASPDRNQDCAVERNVSSLTVAVVTAALSSGLRRCYIIHGDRTVRMAVAYREMAKGLSKLAYPWKSTDMRLRTVRSRIISAAESLKRQYGLDPILFACVTVLQLATAETGRGMFDVVDDNKYKTQAGIDMAGIASYAELVENSFPSGATDKHGRVVLSHTSTVVVDWAGYIVRDVLGDENYFHIHHKVKGLWDSIEPDVNQLMSAHIVGDGVRNSEVGPILEPASFRMSSDAAVEAIRRRQRPHLGLLQHDVKGPVRVAAQEVADRHGHYHNDVSNRRWAAICMCEHVSEQMPRLHATFTRGWPNFGALERIVPIGCHDTRSKSGAVIVCEGCARILPLIRASPQMEHDPALVTLLAALYGLPIICPTFTTPDAITSLEIGLEDMEWNPSHAITCDYQCRTRFRNRNLSVGRLSMLHGLIEASEIAGVPPQPPDSILLRQSMKKPTHINIQTVCDNWMKQGRPRQDIWTTLIVENEPSDPIVWVLSHPNEQGRDTWHVHANMATALAYPSVFDNPDLLLVDVDNYYVVTGDDYKRWMDAATDEGRYVTTPECRPSVWAFTVPASEFEAAFVGCRDNPGAQYTLSSLRQHRFNMSAATDIVIHDRFETIDYLAAMLLNHNV